MGEDEPTEIPRRTIARGAMWSVPVLASAGTASATSTSCELPTVQLVSTAGSNGYDVRLADGKVRANAGVNYLASGNMAQLVFVVRKPDGTVWPGIAVSVTSDGSVTDDEGNAMIRFAPPGSPSQPESPGASTVTAPADAQGRVTVWAATATYRSQDRAVNPALDNHGTFTVAVPAQPGVCAATTAFTFQVIDAAPLAGGG